MSQTSRPAVERITPPRAPYDVVNRVMRWLLSEPRRAQRVGRHLLLLHLVGRRSRRPITVPVAYRETGDGELLVLTSAVWRLNLRDADAVEVTLRGVRGRAGARLVEDPDEVARVYRDLVAAVGPRAASRRLGIRISVDRVPTHDELVEAARRDGLALVYLRPEGVRA